MQTEQQADILTTATKIPGLTGFSLKYLAMFLMVLDHIHYFFEFTGKVPLAFSWLGRLSAPLFLFCVVEGFCHTHDRKKYFLRIYGISIVMGLIQFSFYNIGSGLVRPDGFFPQNQMLTSLALLIILLQGIEWCQKKNWLRGILTIVFVLFVPYLIFLLLIYVFHAFGVANLLAFTILPIHFSIADGGTATLIAGTALYLFRKNSKKQALAFVIVALLLDVVYPMIVMTGLHFSDFFTQAYEWMEIFAVIPMLCYNGTRGNGSKQLFYWFYPAHIYLLYALSFFVINL